MSLFMPQEMDLEQGTARQCSGELRNETNSVSQNIQRDSHSGVETRGIRELSKTYYCIVVRRLLHVKKILDPQEPFGNLICLILCVIAILIDPLFFYILVINDDKKCVRLDKKLGIAVSVVRSIFDFFYIIYIILKMHTNVFASFSLMYNGDNRKKIAGKHLLRFFLIDLLAILPLPQVVILIIIPAMRGSKFLYAMNLLKFFVLFQYAPRVIRIYPLVTKASRSSGKLTEATWAKVAFNLLLYMLAAHVFGALWYFFSIERDTVCWKNACSKRTGCNHDSFYCDEISGNDTFLNDFCPTKTQNTTIFDFGIFNDALQSGIVEGKDFPQKLLHCFFWGLQSLSCFGQNLRTSTYIWEDFFAILITISALMLFLFLIGNMQIYLQSKTIRSEEMRLKGREIEQWAPFRKLSGNLQQQVWKYQRYVWRETKGVDVENFLNNLPRELRGNIKRELCLELLRKVEEFKKLNDATLHALCDCVKPAFYIERTHIVREGYPIDEMLFVVQGKLWTYTSKAKTSGSSSSHEFRKYDKIPSKKDHLEDGDVCGEELIPWAMDAPSSSNLPVSTRTIQALTKVEAFALMADDLKNVFIKHQLSSSPVLDIDRFIKAVCVIQEAWRRNKSRRNLKGSTREKDSGLQHVLNVAERTPPPLSIQQHERTPPPLSIQQQAHPERTPPPLSVQQQAQPEIIVEES